jgi:hypothetical protein
VEDMFKEKHLPDLLEALKELVTKANKQEKTGNKKKLHAILLRSVKSLESYYCQTEQSAKVKEVKDFRSAFRGLSEESQSGGNFPSVHEVQQVKDYIAAEILSAIKDNSVKDFSWLRSLVVASLTLYNARRGKEAAGILVSEWEHAENGEQLPEGEVETVMDSAEQFLAGKFMLAHLKEKGTKYVPLLIPNGLLSAIRVMKQERVKFGIRENNLYLFATKISASSYRSGWHAVAEVCGKSGARLCTRAKSRYGLSCVYASLDMSPEDRENYLQLIGYEEQHVNTENCLNPPGSHTAETNTAKHSISDGGNFFLFSCCLLAHLSKSYSEIVPCPSPVCPSVC